MSMADAFLPAPEPEDDLGERDETELEAEIDRDEGASVESADGDATGGGASGAADSNFRTPTAGDRLTAEGLAQELETGSDPTP